MTAIKLSDVISLSCRLQGNLQKRLSRIKARTQTKGFHLLQQPSLWLVSDYSYSSVHRAIDMVKEWGYWVIVLQTGIDWMAGVDREALSLWIVLSACLRVSNSEYITGTANMRHPWWLSKRAYIWPWIFSSDGAVKGCKIKIKLQRTDKFLCTAGLQQPTFASPQNRRHLE